MKLAVLYDSKTGNTAQAAAWIAEGMNEVENVEAMAFSIEDADVEFVKASRGVVIGSPSYAALMTPDLHAWLQTNGNKLKLSGKLGGAFATAQFTHGGGDLVIQSILTFEMVKGMLCYSGGASCGMPVIHLGPVAINNNVEKHNSLDIYKGYFNIYGKRFAEKARELFS